MFSHEMVVSIFIFTGMLLLFFGIYSYISYHKGRWELSRRIKQIEGEVPSGRQVDGLARVKTYWLNLFGSLGHFVKPKDEEEISHLRRTFLKAGYRGGNGPIIFFGTKVFLAVWLPSLFFLARLVIQMVIPSLTLLLISILLVTIGFYLPNLWIKMRISKRKEKMQQGLPDALDLMVVCVEAGTGLDAAINRVGEEMKLSNKVLSEEFRLMSMELRAGKQRRDALKNLALRTDLEDVNSLVTLLIQTEKFGTSLAQALRVHSDSMRTKRFQKAEEIAAKLPVKLIFPLVLFIFPSLFVTILGPAAIRIFRILFPVLSGG
jgi:tight adherence protein C